MVPPQKKTKCLQDASTVALATIISSFVKDISEVDFSSQGKDSLYDQICRVRKKSNTRAEFIKYQRNWENNSQNIRGLVKQLLDMKVDSMMAVKNDSKAVREGCTTAGRPTDETPPETIKTQHLKTDSNKFNPVDPLDTCTDILGKKENDSIKNDLRTQSLLYTTSPVSSRTSRLRGPQKILRQNVANDLPFNSEMNGCSTYTSDSDVDDGTATIVQDIDSSSSTDHNNPAVLRKPANKEKKRLGRSQMDCNNEDDTDEESASSVSSIGSHFSEESTSKYNPPSMSSTAKTVFAVMEGQYSSASTNLLGPDGQVNADKLRCELENIMLNEVKYACPLRFYSLRHNLNCIVIYARCRYVSHEQKFRFDVTDLQSAIMNIYISSTRCTDIVHDGKPIFRTLKGQERTQVKEELRHTPPRMYQLKVNEKIDPEIAADGHFQNARKLSTYQKAKSEDNCRDDILLRSQDLSDLFQKHILELACKDPYIRRTGIPLYAHMYSEEQLNIIEKGNRIVHFDATGSIVRKPKDIQSKRIMYYAMIINQNGSLIPVAEMISAEHDITSISMFLKQYRTFVQIKNGSWPLFTVVVVDWSWASIHAVMDEWNRMTILDYLKEVYLCLVNETEIRSNLIVVHSCCAHFQKRVSTKLHQKFPKDIENKTLILECMGLLVHCNDIRSLDNVYTEFMTILLEKSATVANKSISKIHKLHSEICDTQLGIDSLNAYDDKTIEFVPQDRRGEKIFADSPFFGRYYAKLSTMKSDILEGMEITNQYYAPEVAEYITKRYMPFVPMWSAVLLKKVAPDVKRLSNANVESFFNIVKKFVLKSQVNLKIGRFITDMKTYKTQLCAEQALNLPLKKRRHKIVRRSRQNPDNPLVQEMWQRKKKAQFSHFEGRSLGRIAKKITPVTSTPLRSPGIAMNSPQNEMNLTLLNHSENSNHANSMDNGLFDDNEYYWQDIECQFTVGRYSVLHCDPIIGFDTQDLFSDEYRTLKDRNWIDGHVIDALAIASVQRNWRNVLYVPTGYTSYMIGNHYEAKKAKSFRMYQVSQELTDKLLLPYLFAQHWCLLIIDVKNQSISHIDPKCKQSPDERRAINAFKTYLKECSEINKNHLCEIPWKKVAYSKDRPMQAATDFHNCGVYVMYYMNCIGKDDPFDMNFDPQNYRLEVAKNLLELSENMSLVCHYCFNMDSASLQVMCNTCRRWSHQLCLRRQFNDVTDYECPTAKYRCALCRNGFRQWMLYKRI